MAIIAFLAGTLVGGLLTLFALAEWIEGTLDDDGNEYDER